MDPIIPTRRSERFDDPSFIFELKLDGFSGHFADTGDRCVVNYCGGQNNRKCPQEPGAVCVQLPPPPPPACA
jgi:hypothetical protein